MKGPVLYNRDEDLLAAFPRTRAMQHDVLRRYAWLDHPAAIEAALARFLSGELPSGPPSQLRSLHIIPISFYGETMEAAFAPAGMELRNFDEDGEWEAYLK